VQATYREVYSLCLRILKDPHDATDATQDAYVKAWRGLAGFRGDAAFTTWMFRIATNASLSKLRTKKRRLEHEGSSDESVIDRVASPASTEDTVGARIDAHVLEEAIRSLPEQHRVAVVMRDVYGLSTGEVARQLGITETAAKVRVHRARKKLREVLFAAAEEESRDEV
jgi:RNA polymerase sigma-70 factor (ECF subfamily)